MERRGKGGPGSQQTKPIDGRGLGCRSASLTLSARVPRSQQAELEVVGFSSSKKGKFAAAGGPSLSSGSKPASSDLPSGPRSKWTERKRVSDLGFGYSSERVKPTGEASVLGSGSKLGKPARGGGGDGPKLGSRSEQRAPAAGRPDPGSRSEQGKPAAAGGSGPVSRAKGEKPAGGGGSGSSSSSSSGSRFEHGKCTTAGGSRSEQGMATGGGPSQGPVPQGAKSSIGSNPRSKKGKMTFVWCLRRIGMDTEWLLLEENTEVTIGRGFGLTYRLTSEVCPLMISRNHCCFKQNAEGQWTVTDNKSLNGVWVNKERIEPLIAHPLTEGDLIQLGVAVKDSDRAEHEYSLIRDQLEKIRSSLAKRSSQEVERVKSGQTKRKYTSEESDTSGTEVPGHFKMKLKRVSCDSKQTSQWESRKVLAGQPTECAEQALPPATPGPSREPSGAILSARQDCGRSAPERSERSRTGSRSPCPKSVELAKLQQNMGTIQRLKTQVREAERQASALQTQHCDQAGSSLQALQEEVQELQAQLQLEQEEQQQRVAWLEKTFCEEEQRLEDEGKRQTEDCLKQQLADALQEHRKLMEELRRSQKNFEETIQAKERELEETKEEKQKVMAQKEEFLSQMTEVLENELQCIICSEHLIEAVTLNCAHSFCCYCIHEWRRRKDECPICRQPIVSQTRSLVLDNCINRMVENLSTEVKERRVALIRERKGEREMDGSGKPD
ncbi:E3 ubiquitin-protein ligase rnf8 isoform X2 [Latimeria chalumnae]|uniref:E3 ubiquitin-protein ligase rnf8 isoform X2 n=1 Tax=Latimeria chalumnae TaxID=7897 RepID=UPI0006D8E45E|nr:PREDICTED: E3 ubiquitin-protein ligase RNF8 isoform X2 [Latimeria chalumnae]|eukprot:XP_014353013.1 PREDICTED: E3 ubiquitin-protein ligase RNF8 isoform X2 [Latimeria chalumnae]